MATPFDPAAEANDLANKFIDLSQSVDDFRLNLDPPPSQPDASRLKDEAQGLEDRAHHFTAVAIGDTLASVQSSLDQIKSVTTQARAQLEVLNDVQQGISIATLGLSLGTAIAGGDVPTILAATQALGDALAAL